MRTSLPYTFALPESGFRIPRIIFIVVDFPEPFGPRSPSISPRRKAKVRWSTARVAPKDFAREVASSAFAPPFEGVDKRVLSTAFPFRIRTFRKVRDLGEDFSRVNVDRGGSTSPKR